MELLYGALTEVVGDRSAQIAVHHVDNRDTADDIAKTLTVRLPQIAPPTVTDMGPGPNPVTVTATEIGRASCRERV